MMEICMKFGIALLAVALVVAVPVVSAQRSYPEKPIHIIAPAPPGGAFDFVARAAAEGLQKALGQPVIVDNRSGAGGLIGVEAAAKSPGDGYTLVVGSTGPFSVAQSLYKQLRFDPVKDFVPIARLLRMPSYVVVHPGVQANNMKELLALARAHPGRLTYASTGNGLSQHTNVELLKSMANIFILPVPYRGSGPANVDLLGGQVDMMIELGPQAIPFVKAGKLKVLAVTTATRSQAMPEVPTVAESGVPGFDAFTWFALYAPAGTPREIIQKLHGELVTIFSQPEVKTRMAAIGAELALSSPEELKSFQSTEIGKWSAVIKRVGIQLE